jgi:hypothetical protein
VAADEGMRKENPSSLSVRSIKAVALVKQGVDEVEDRRGSSYRASLRDASCN